jgi:hypothetical protein
VLSRQHAPTKLDRARLLTESAGSAINRTVN